MDPPEVPTPLDQGDPKRVANFRILARLGSGGMGRIYRAEDEVLHREVALKLLLSEHTGDSEHRQRFLREARVAASLVHPNVALVYQVGEDAGRVYIAMEIVEGTTLRERLGPTGLAGDLARDLALQMARGLAAAHAAGIVHRDFKPENVMVTTSGVAKLLDFGLAKSGVGLESDGEIASAETETQITEEGHILGTTPYMSPEQTVGVALDTRSDVFSFGVVLYEMLVGHRPFGGATVGAVRMAILREEAIPPSDKARGVDANLASVAMRCLEKSASARFSDASAIVRAIEVPGEHALSAQRPKSRTGAYASRPWIRAVSVLALLVAGLGAWRGFSAPRTGSSRTVVGAMPSALAIGGCNADSGCSSAHPGEAWHCQSQRHVCVPVASVDCKAEVEPLDMQRDDIVWLGGMFPLSSEPDFDAEAHAVELARREIAQTLGSSANETGPMRARPLGLVLCDEGADAVRAARHLAEDIEVPAVIGFRGPSSALATIPPVFLPNRVLSFISIAQQTDLTKLPEPPGEPRLVWRSTLDMAGERAPTNALVAEVLEPLARSRPAGIGKRPMRVAVVFNRARTGDNADADFRELHFNGKSALENGADFRIFVRDSNEKAEGNVSQVVDALIAFNPQVIYERSGSPAKVVIPLEERWPRSTPPPLYVVGSDFERALDDFIGKSPERRRRFFAVTNVSTVQNRELVLRHNMAYPKDGVTPTASPQPSYDAFYTLAYAAYALGDEPITGPALSRAMGRLLPPGRAVDVGPSHIFEGLQTLRSGGNIDLVGAMGSLDFDPSTGEAPVDYAILCCGVDEKGAASGSVESGLVYETRSAKLAGRLRCP